MFEMEFGRRSSARRRRASVKDRQTEWGSNDACVATQLRLRYGLAWIMAVSWAELDFKDAKWVAIACMAKDLLQTCICMCYKVPICTYMLWGGMRSEMTAFFRWHFFLRLAFQNWEILACGLDNRLKDECRIDWAVGRAAKDNDDDCF